MFYIVDYMKALACLLIANFHSDILFPDNLALLAFGGDVGNNFFFMISGFILCPSIERCELKHVGKWYGKRLYRILPMLSLFYIATALMTPQFSGWREIIRMFVFPTIYWFTGAILLFYLLLFFLIKFCSRIVRIGICQVMLVLHIFFDGIIAERYFMGFIAMIVGAELSFYVRKHIGEIRVKAIFAGIICSGMAYVALKLVRKELTIFPGVVHLGIGLMTIVLATNCILDNMK